MAGWNTAGINALHNKGTAPLGAVLLRRAHRPLSTHQAQTFQRGTAAARGGSYFSTLAAKHQSLSSFDFCDVRHAAGSGRFDALISGLFELLLASAWFHLVDSASGGNTAGQLMLPISWCAHNFDRVHAGRNGLPLPG